MTEGQEQFIASQVPADHQAIPMDLQTKYRIVLGQGLGPEVLANMIYELGLLEEIPLNSPEAVVEHNYAVRLLTTLGVINTSENGLQRIVDAMLTIPLENKEK